MCGDYEKRIFYVFGMRFKKHFLTYIIYSIWRVTAFFYLST